MNVAGASTAGAGGIETGGRKWVAAAGVSGETFAAGRGSAAATSFLGANCRLTATEADTVNVSTPATSRASGPFCASCLRRCATGRSST